MKSARRRLRKRSRGNRGRAWVVMSAPFGMIRGFESEQATDRQSSAVSRAGRLTIKKAMASLLEGSVFFFPSVMIWAISARKISLPQ